MPLPPVINGTTQGAIDSNGSFSVGSTAAFFFTFTDIDGQLFNPSDIGAVITDNTSTIVETFNNADHLELGKFSVTWAIPVTATTGIYTITTTYIAETATGPVTNSFAEQFVVSEKGQGFAFYRNIAMRAFLEALVGYTQRIPVFHEPALLNNARNVASLTFPRWNQTAGVRVLINGQNRESGYTVDYLKGKVYFNNTLSQYDQVLISYNFRWFTDDEMDLFVQQGVEYFNVFPPQSVYNILNLPDRFVVVTEYAAAVNVIRRFMMDILFQEPVKVFGGPTRADQIFSHMNEIKQNYEDQLKLALEQKKFGPYTGLTKTVTIPEYALPGGRCFSPETLVEIIIGGKCITYDLITLYDIFSNDKNIYIKSHVRRDGEQIVYAKLGRIWLSGFKKVYKLQTESGKNVSATLEHLFYIEGKGYIPMQEIKINDFVICENNGLVFLDKVKSIEFDKLCDTYDLEVPLTENLFANGIKCHNSRWFKFIFK